MSDRTKVSPGTAPPSIPCLVCEGPIEVSLTSGRKSGKPGIALKCRLDPRHFRAFITDQDYVRGVLKSAKDNS